MSDSPLPPDTLFENAPPIGLQRRLGLIEPHNLRVGRRALLVVLIGWLPLLLLSAAQALVWGRAEHLTSLLWAADIHGRYLLAAPLFVFAERHCAPRLRQIVRQFVDGDLILEQDHDRFERAVSSTRRLVESTTAEVMVVVITGLIVAIAIATRPLGQLSTWQLEAAAPVALSPAGWWQILVSAPLLLVMYIGWLWRLALWTRLLWKISRLRLRLIAAHSDRAAGLIFVGHSLRAFSIVAFAMATVAAGRSAQIVLVNGTLPKGHLYFNIGLLVFVVALFTAPLFVFTPKLLETWRRGIFEYGALAARAGSVFEKKWLARDRRIDTSMLQLQDFSATTDLYQVVGNVYAMRLFPLDNTDFAFFVVTLLLPFIPVLLLAVPTDVLWSHLQDLVF